MDLVNSSVLGEELHRLRLVTQGRPLFRQQAAGEGPLITREGRSLPSV